MSWGAGAVVTAAVEGDIDEAVVGRVLERTGFSLGRVHGRLGKARLLAALPGYNNAARYAPWMVLVDLDRDCDCAPNCVRQWLPVASQEMCFRAAVRAIEAWLLADTERMAEFLGVSENRMPRNPDELDDPKQALINLARNSRYSRVRLDLVPSVGSGRKVGPLYNARMVEFVEDRTDGWRVDEAANVSESLARWINRLGDFV